LILIQITTIFTVFVVSEFVFVIVKVSGDTTKVTGPHHGQRFVLQAKLRPVVGSSVFALLTSIRLLRDFHTRNTIKYDCDRGTNRRHQPGLARDAQDCAEQSVLSFLFNLAIIGMSINIAAWLVSR